MEIKLQNDNHLIMVDDSEIDVMLMKRYINRSNLENEFLHFYSGEEFLKHMDDARVNVIPMPALVFLDINMPRMDGFEVLSELRKFSEFDSLPVVTFLTNSNDPQDIERCQSLNATMQEKFSDTDKCVAYLNGLKP